MINIIFLGPPGSGKGTQAGIIADKLNIVHLSTGDVFREHIKNGTELGKQAQDIMAKGHLVSDDITNNMVKETLSHDKFKNGVILDGYPRTIDQTQALDEMFASMGKTLDHVVLFDIDHNLLIERLTGRRVCPTCKKAYHIKFSPPAKEGFCDDDGAELQHRPDDTAEKAEERLRVYGEQTEPLIKHYEEKGLLIKVDAAIDKDELAEIIINKVSK